MFLIVYFTVKKIPKSPNVICKTPTINYNLISIIILYTDLIKNVRFSLKLGRPHVEIGILPMRNVLQNWITNSLCDWDIIGNAI